MYKVLLVDDDSIIRVKLQNLIDWNTFDCEIVAEASNGQEALDYIETYRPQIVITDMDMPGMSGVELIRHIRERHEQIVVIALSAYDDFPYVRGSLKCGAIDYLLKHQMTTAKMEAVIKDAICRVSVKGGVVDAEFPVSDKAFFQKLLRPGDESAGEMLEEYYRSNGVLKNKKLIMALGTFGRAPVMEKMSGKQKSYVESIFQETLAFYEQKILFCFYEEKPVFLFFMEPMQDENYVIDFLNQQIENIDRFVSARVCFMISSPFYDLKNIRVVLEALQQNDLSQRSFDSLPAISKEDGQAAGRSTPITLTLQDEQWLCQNLREKNMPVIAPFLHNKFRELIQNHVGLSQLQFLAIDCINVLNKQLQDDHYSEKEIYGTQNPFAILQDAQSGVMLEKLLLQFYGLYCNADNTEERYNNQIINQAIKYIKEHISQSFSLKDISSYLAVNSAYLSRLFKKNTGKTIVTYINDEKMKMARELIESGALTLKEVALATGFQNYNHFYLLFKETYGISPSEIKKSK